MRRCRTPPAMSAGQARGPGRQQMMRTPGGNRRQARPHRRSPCPRVRLPELWIGGDPFRAPACPSMDVPRTTGVRARCNRHRLRFLPRANARKMKRMPSAAANTAPPMPGSPVVIVTTKKRAPASSPGCPAQLWAIVRDDIHGRSNQSRLAFGDALERGHQCRIVCISVRDALFIGFGHVGREPPHLHRRCKRLHRQMNIGAIQVRTDSGRVFFNLSERPLAAGASRSPDKFAGAVVGVLRPWQRFMPE